MQLRKNFNQTWLSLKKIYISVSGYLLLGYMELRKKVIWIRPSPEKNLILGYNTIMVHGTYKSFSWYLILTE